MIATKPLKPKNIYSKLSISRFIKEYDYKHYLIIGEDRFAECRAKDSKHAKNKFRKRYPKQKILTIKKLK